MTKIGVIPRDEGTRTLLETELVVRGIDAVHQVWVWSGIKGESLILKATDVADLDDDALMSLLDSSGLKTSVDQATISRSSTDYVFLNFNFFEM